jgi:hypothetical protein
VEVVYVLGHDTLKQTKILHLNKCIMARIRFRFVYCKLHLISRVARLIFIAETRFPPLTRIIQKFAVRKVRRLTVLGPKSPRSSEGRYSALNRKPGPRKCYNVTSAKDEPCGLI